MAEEIKLRVKLLPDMGGLVGGGGGRKEVLKTLKLFKIDLYWKWLKGTWNFITKYLPLMKAFSNILDAVFQLIALALTLPFLKDIVNFLSWLLQASIGFFKWMKEHGPQVREAAGLGIKAILAVLGVEGLTKAFGTLWSILTKVSPFFALLSKVVGFVIEKLGLKGLSGVLEKAVGFFAKFINPLLWINLIASLLQAVLSWALGEDNPITRFVGFIAELTDVVGWLIAAFKDLLGLFGLGKTGSLSEKLSGMGKLIGLQDGGIVTSPTAALIGEAGPEAVVPLDRMGNGSTTINVQGLVDEQKFRSIIREEFNKMQGRLHKNRGAVGV